MTTVRKPATLWCIRCELPREFVGPKCLVQLLAHYGEAHCPPAPERYFTLHEVSEITGITQWTLWQRRKAGTLPAQREDRTGIWMVAGSDIEKIRPVRARNVRAELVKEELWAM